MFARARIFRCAFTIAGILFSTTSVVCLKRNAMWSAEAWRLRQQTLVRPLVRCKLHTKNRGEFGRLTWEGHNWRTSPREGGGGGLKVGVGWANTCTVSVSSPVYLFSSGTSSSKTILSLLSKRAPSRFVVVLSLFQTPIFSQIGMSCLYVSMLITATRSEPFGRAQTSMHIT